MPMVTHVITPIRSYFLPQSNKQKNYANPKNKEIYLRPSSKAKLPIVSLDERAKQTSHTGQSVDDELQQTEGFCVLTQNKQKYLGLNKKGKLYRTGFDGERIAIGEDGKLSITKNNKERFKIVQAQPFDFKEKPEFQYDRINGQKIMLTSEDIPYITNEKEKWLIDLDKRIVARDNTNVIKLSRGGYPYSISHQLPTNYPSITAAMLSNGDIVLDEAHEYSDLIWTQGPKEIQELAKKNLIKISPCGNFLTIRTGNTDGSLAQIQEGQICECITEHHQIRVTELWQSYVIFEGEKHLILPTEEKALLPSIGSSPIKISNTHNHLFIEGNNYEKYVVVAIKTEDPAFDIFRGPRYRQLLFQNRPVKISPRDDGILYVDHENGNKYIVLIMPSGELKYASSSSIPTAYFGLAQNWVVQTTREEP